MDEKRKEAPEKVEVKYQGVPDPIEMKDEGTPAFLTYNGVDSDEQDTAWNLETER